MPAVFGLLLQTEKWIHPSASCRNRLNFKLPLIVKGLSAGKIVSI